MVTHLLEHTNYDAVALPWRFRWRFVTTPEETTSESRTPSRGTVRIYTGRGPDGDERVYMGYGRAVWNNDGDTARFYNADDELLVEEQYSGNCESGYHPCRESRQSASAPTQTRTPSTPTRTPGTGEETAPVTVGDTKSPTRSPTARATATDSEDSTATVTAEEVAVQGTEMTDADGGATADAPGFGAIATLGGLATATAHLLKRADESDDK